MMTRDEHAAILAAILSGAGDPAVISDQVTRLSENYAAALADSALMAADNESLAAKNAALIDQNMKLFLKVGAVPPAEAAAAPEEPVKTFEELFDENGRLK